MNRYALSILLTIAALSPVGLALAGPRDGGGGNVAADSPLSEEVLSSLADSAYLSLPGLFEHIRVWSQAPVKGSQAEGELRKSIAAKIFAPGSEKKLSETLKASRIDVKASGACLSPAGEERDASASAFPSRRVCLSFERLSAKITFGASQPKIMALLAHEVSHFFGTTEAEAVLIQDFIEKRIQREMEQLLEDRSREVEAENDLPPLAEKLHCKVLVSNGTSSGDWQTYEVKLDSAHPFYNKRDLPLPGRPDARLEISAVLESVAGPKGGIFIRVNDGDLSKSIAHRRGRPVFNHESGNFAQIVTTGFIVSLSCENVK